MAGVDALLVGSSRDFSHLAVGARATSGCSAELPASSAAPAGGDADGRQSLTASPGVLPAAAGHLELCGEHSHPVWGRTS